MNFRRPINKVNLVVVLFFLVASACKKKDPEVLAKDDKKKVVLLQVDYDDFAFNCGKEFSYFEDSSLGIDLPVDSTIVFSGNTTRITMLYGDLHDTIFDGTQIYQGTGSKEYPDNMDNQIFYYRTETTLPNPTPETYQLLYYDQGTAPIPYDSIWKELAKLQLVQQYRSSNPNSKIGLFLYRPSDVEATTDWKWYVVLRD